MKGEGLCLKNGKQQISEYDILRVIVTFLVIIGHCTYYKISTPYGGCDYTGYIEPELSTFYKIANIISFVIYLFHMPLYMALSGALFRYQNVEKCKSISFINFIKGKSFKLIIPFLVVTVLYQIPIKYLSGYYNSSTNIVRDISIGQIFIQGNTHLWFLPTLFFIFALAFLINKYIHANDKLILVVSFAASFISLIMPIVVIKQILYYIFWFYVGYCFESYRHIVNKKIDNCPYLLILCTVLFFVTVIALKLIPQKSGADIFDILERIINYFCAILGCFVVYLFSYILSRTKIKETKAFAIIRNSTFGLYLYSDTLNYVILKFYTDRFGSVLFTTNFGSSFLIFSRMIITFTIALIISIFLKKCKIKYIC